MTKQNPSAQQVTAALRAARRIVVKVGSSLVTNEGRGLDDVAIGEWCRQISLMTRADAPPSNEEINPRVRREVVMVSSGAVAEGMKRLGWLERPREVHELQAAAAVGQMGLVQMYEAKFREQGLASAQVLLTHADLANRERYLNARSTLLTLLRLGVIPVINENDTVVNEAIKFGDNDTLGALVTNLIDADLLILLTDQRGLFSADPRGNPLARFVEAAQAGDPQLESMAAGVGSHIGRGGMITKVLAAKRAAGSGASTVIAWGRAPEALLRLLEGENIGTFLIAPTQKTQARKQWIADHLQLRGSVMIDEGAAFKVRDGGKSLLPIGVISVDGEFSRGDVIAIRSPAGLEIARGLANYSSTEARLICRRPSSEFEAMLGYAAEPEMVHRTNLVLTN